MAKAAQKAGLSLNGTVKEMMDLQQAGALVSSKVLPHFAEMMSKAAQANNGLKFALLSNRVAMNRMATSAQVAAETIFKSGFGEGLTELFNNTADMIKENETLWKGLGGVLGKVFKGVALVIKNVISPVFSALGSIINGLSTAMDNFGGWIGMLLAPLGLLSPALQLVIKQLGGIKLAGKALAIAARGFLLPFTLILGTLEEIAEFFAPSGKKTLLNFNIDDLTKSLEKFSMSHPEEASKFRNKSPFGGYLGTDLRPNQPSTPQVIEVKQGDVYLENEKVGKVLSGTNAIRSLVDSRINDLATDNY